MENELKWMYRRIYKIILSLMWKIDNTFSIWNHGAHMYWQILPYYLPDGAFSFHSVPEGVIVNFFWSIMYTTGESNRYDTGIVSIQWNLHLMLLGDFSDPKPKITVFNFLSLVFKFTAPRNLQ
jgi:hypothetical protein